LDKRGQRSLANRVLGNLCDGQDSLYDNLAQFADMTDRTLLFEVSHRELKVTRSQPPVAGVPGPRSASRGNRLTAGVYFCQTIAEMERLSRRRTVPQMFIDGKGIGGFDDARFLDSTGELDRLLGIRPN